MSLLKIRKCLCHSGQDYSECCEPFHEGKWPQTCIELMRSRYSAYALSKVDYIIETTHKQNPDYQKNKKNWKESILLFCKCTQFEDLHILSHVENQDEGFVTFTAVLKQNGLDISFTEKSRFVKEMGRWLYFASVPR